MLIVSWLASPTLSDREHQKTKGVDATSHIKMENQLFGFTEDQIAQFGLTFGVSAFILYMLFIVYNLARESKAGKFGTFILFLVLSFGMLGFVAKNIIKWVLGM
jgi:hypothetical protein